MKTNHNVLIVDNKIVEETKEFISLDSRGRGHQQTN